MKNNIKIVGDIVDVLNLRSYLIFCNEEYLDEVCQTDEDYLMIIYDLMKLLKIDNGNFVLLDDIIINKVYKLINSRRFEIKKDHPEAYELVNDMISFLNKISSFDGEKKDDIRNNYLVEQSNKRQLNYKNYNAFIKSLGVDSFVLDRLAGDDIPDSIPKEFIVGSINYLKTIMPKLSEIECVNDVFDDLLKEFNNDNEEEFARKRKKKIKKR